MSMLVCYWNVHVSVHKKQTFLFQGW